MPAISRFFGIVITMNYNDHPPPHFHIRYAGQRALMAIDTLTTIRGHLSPRVLGLVVEWAAQHRSELIENWDWPCASSRCDRSLPWSSEMLRDITAVRPTQDYRLELRFDDGTQGEIDVSELIRFDGVFAPLKDLAEFTKVRVDPELGTIRWPNGADLDPDVLYARITGEPISIARTAVDATERR